MDSKELADAIARLCIENGCDETSFEALSSRIRHRIIEMRAELEAARLGETIGDRIKRMRMAQGLTLRGLGEMIGVGGAAVHQWETGGSKDMKNETLLRLAQALDVEPGLLVWGPTGQPALKRVSKRR
jgi:DNA-binding Xre family transcriptional regulator